jgi:hypothetical protein
LTFYPNLKKILGKATDLLRDFHKNEKKIDIQKKNNFENGTFVIEKTTTKLLGTY